MAYDTDLAERIRIIIGLDPDMVEKKMFGGLAFLINGNMAIAASGKGGIMVRVDPAEGKKLVEMTPATLMEMRGRHMVGWLRVDTDTVAANDELRKWVELGVAYARSLPVK